ncbi:ABC transporter ATP-binding protein [Aureispira sp. CCB-QB1]|uniref:ABC transporter transmembrane domain-containing protein n=1 Tax=Aureispira sp. CCB-QB1 TaxID=1313421 RepID=UPI00069799BF|nr:ABC transporter ATP-binding protein [Aureispira sp. CCB-QB1]
MALISKNKLILQFIKSYKLKFCAVIFVGFTSSILKISIPISLAKYYSLVFETNSPKIFLFNFFPSYFTNTIPHFLIFFFALILLTGLFDFLERFGKGALGEFFLFQLRKILFSKQLHIKQMTYDAKGTGRYLLRYSGDLKSIQRYLTKGIVQFIIDLLFITLTMAVLFIINPTICLIILGCTVITFVFMVFVNRWLYNISSNRRNRKSNLLSFVSVHLRSILSIKSFNKEKKAYKKFARRAKRILDLGISYHLINSFIQTMTKSTVYIMLGIILTFVHLSSWQSGSELFITILILVTILPLFRRTLRVFSIWELGNISFTKLLNIINTEAETLPTQDSIERISGNKVIINNLSFEIGNQELFKNTSMVIPSKSITLITGKGKTTLGKILLGIYDNYQGTILINRTNIRQIPPKVVRRKVTIASVDWPLYGKTVFDAISYNKREKKRVAAKALLKALQSKYNQQLTLDTPIGELGQNLSHNQYVLLCFARAILTKKKILILDLPFQTLTPSLKSTLLQFINGLKDQKTIIIFGQNEAEFKQLSIDKKYILGAPPMQYTLN